MQLWCRGVKHLLNLIVCKKGLYIPADFDLIMPAIEYPPAETTVPSTAAILEGEIVTEYPAVDAASVELFDGDFPWQLVLVHNTRSGDGKLPSPNWCDNSYGFGKSASALRFSSITSEGSS